MCDRALPAIQLASVRAALTACTLALAACSGGGGASAGPVEPELPAASCQARTTVDLQPGQHLSLTPDQAACFRLAAHPSARYVLAGFDARGVESARIGPEAAPAGEPTYLLGDGTPTAAVAVPSASRAAGQVEADFTVRRAAAGDEADPFARAAPWREGERFAVRRKDGSGTATARVVRVYGGHYVLAVVDEDASSHAPKFVDQAGRALDFLVREGAGVLERAYGGARPVTSAGSGQLLVVLAAWNPDLGAGNAVTQAAPDGSGVASAIWLNLEVRPGVREGFDRLDHASYRLKLLVHELTHAWQVRYAYDAQPAGPRAVSFGPVWAMEGTADLVGMDLVRRFLGVGLTSNYDWQASLRTGGAEAVYALEPFDTRGRLARGYFDAASFLRDVQVRLSRAGLSPDDALAQVARGAVEGWFGVDGAGVRRQGLAERVRAVLGSGWDPSQAVLLWTLTQAADDQTQAPDLNNPVYARAADPDGDYAWKPVVDELQAGRSFAYEVRRTPGSSFFVRLKDDGRGGTFSASASVAETRWMVARVR
ncbi:MAG TPA: hypothetical protein VF746_21765 [Longimicrobium sp.]|jgi:hypothetical protein